MKSKDDWVLQDDWSVLVTFLPYGWKEKVKELGAWRRCRRFADAEPLLRTLLIHLAQLPQFDLGKSFAGSFSRSPMTWRGPAPRMSAHQKAM